MNEVSRLMQSGKDLLEPASARGSVFVRVFFQVPVQVALPLPSWSGL